MRYQRITIPADKKREPPHCYTCLSRITPENPVQEAGGCAWCNGQGDYSD